MQKIEEINNNILKNAQGERRMMMKKQIEKIFSLWLFFALVETKKNKMSEEKNTSSPNLMVINQQSITDMNARVIETNNEIGQD